MLSSWRRNLPAASAEFAQMTRYELRVGDMKTLTVRMPESVVAQIEAESRRRKLSKSDVVRERLSRPDGKLRPPATFEAIADLVGSVDGLPVDLSTRKKHYLKATGYGRKRPR